MGQPNKVTIEKAIVAERIMQEATKSGRKLGKEMIEELAVMFGGLAAAVQPVGTGLDGHVTKTDIDRWLGTKHETAFERYSKLALKAAAELADFQSPRFAPVSVPSPPPDPRGPITKKFTIKIFDHQGRPAPRHIDVTPNRGKEPTRFFQLSRTTDAPRRGVPDLHAVPIRSFANLSLPAILSSPMPRG
jgi:hypothetical protein